MKKRVVKFVHNLYSMHQNLNTVCTKNSNLSNTFTASIGIRQSYTHVICYLSTYHKGIVILLTSCTVI